MAQSKSKHDPTVRGSLAAVRAPTKLTIKLIAALQPGERVRDTDVTGLFVQVSKAGVVAFKYQADVREGPRSDKGRLRTLRVTLGHHPGMTLDDARQAALDLRKQVRAGKDPRAKPPAPPKPWTVARAYEVYIADLAKTPGTDLSRRDLQNRLDRYLAEWRDTPLEALTRETVEQIQTQTAAMIRAAARQRNATGARTANAVVSDLSTLWDFVADYTRLPNNPCRRIRRIGEKKEHHEIPLAELPAWWAAVGALKNPLRRCMHRLGLLSALRPSNLTGIERAWLDLDRSRITFPGRVMKNRELFVLPLSAVMVELVREALAAGDVLERGSPYLFPSRSTKGEVIPIAVLREKAEALKDRTGHALRHTWKNAARAARVPEVSIEILLAHRQRGVAGVYGSLEEQFDRLLADQETVSAHILARAGVAASAG